MELANLNLCKNLDTLINNIQGIDKESASPSDIWFITFKPGTTFNGKPVDTGVMKIYFSPHNTFPIQDEFTDYLKGLEYEARVYEKIIDPLVVKRLCPFFITMFGRGKDCSFDDVVHILFRGVGDLARAEKNLSRNFQMIWGDIPHIPAITRDRDRPIPSDVKINVIDKDFSFMLLRKFTTIHYPLRDYMRSVRSYDESKFWLILFQVCVGLYALELSKTVHNDLHPNNIVIEELDRPEEIIQFIEDENSTPTAYKFTTKYRTVIFDFDRAYAMQLGNNDLLDIISENIVPVGIAYSLIKNLFGSSSSKKDDSCDCSSFCKETIFSFLFSIALNREHFEAVRPQYGSRMIYSNLSDSIGKVLPPALLIHA